MTQMPEWRRATFSEEGSEGEGVPRGGPEHPSRDETNLQSFIIACDAIFLGSLLQPNWTFSPIFSSLHHRDHSGNFCPLSIVHFLPS